MRAAMVLLMWVGLVAFPAAQEKAPLGSQFKGQILFKDGTASSFTSFWSTLSGDKLHFSSDPQRISGDSLALPSIRLANVARIDFLEPTAAEKAVLEQFAGGRKVTVTFRDGQKRERVFLDVTLSKWTGINEEGGLQNDEIVAMVLNWPKPK